MFILIERGTRILKIVEREVFLMESRNQNHLSQWVEYVYGAQSWRKRRYYVNPCLSQLKDKLNSKKGKRRWFSY